MTTKGPQTPAEKEMRERELPARDVRGEDQFPVAEKGARHPRTEGQGGLAGPEKPVDED
jgi:hypothetical protein